MGETDKQGMEGGGGGSVGGANLYARLRRVFLASALAGSDGGQYR